MYKSVALDRQIQYKFEVKYGFPVEHFHKKYMNNLDLLSICVVSILKKGEKNKIWNTIGNFILDNLCSNNTLKYSILKRKIKLLVKTQNICKVCKESTRKRCSCRNIYYFRFAQVGSSQATPNCSKKCQVKDWKYHKLTHKIYHIEGKQIEFKNYPQKPDIVIYKENNDKPMKNLLVMQRS